MLGVGLFLLLIVLLDWVDKKWWSGPEESYDWLERLHKELYDLVDANYDGEDSVRRKAIIDIMVCDDMKKWHGKDYEPKSFKATDMWTRNRIRSERDQFAKHEVAHRPVKGEDEVRKQFMDAGMTEAEWKKVVDQFRVDMNYMEFYSAADKLGINMAQIKSDGKVTLVTVEFYEDGKGYDYLTDFDDIEPGDDVTVFARGSEKVVKVIDVRRADPDEPPLPFYKYKHITGKVSRQRG